MSDVRAVHETIPTVEIEGEEYTLRYDFNAWAQIEEQYGSMDAAIDALANNQTLTGKPATHLRFFLWVGMAQDRPKLTLQEVGRMLTGKNIVRLREAIESAVMASFASGEMGEPGE